ncbi:MAG TPA: hypothetical protein VNW68_06550, partial [Candidatus Limnocylindria bacterium]|nr:hypothetical protein [Candidatus Limnocylindria bacterium]
FRFTSASRPLLEAAARLYGGEVREWRDAPDEGYFELATDAREVDILIPPTLASYSQAFELWDRGGLLRRCDGKVESVTGKACLCASQPEQSCQPTTRVNVMLPKLPGLGVWRLESKGWDAAATLPATLETLGALVSPGTWIPAVLRIERKSVRRRVDGRPQTRRFIVPRIDILGGTIGEALEGGLSVSPARLTAGDGRRERVVRPALPPGPALPADTAMQPVRQPRRPAAQPNEGRGSAPAEGSAPGGAAPDATAAAAPGPLAGTAAATDEEPAVTAEFTVEEVDAVIAEAAPAGDLWQGRKER